ncbi:DUF2269 family protein [Cryptosporangium aurantiacum]|uniref:Predicted integral membrane protein n=1 Tax=Cryptosporangium aurantiacum TaxID=134849 RepID=A0A1M7QTP6_9ACTN|nr:DUF2269 family protein [Cryptosporangium aurantiacum]SHN34839.1 Predicted integral membrane protein [Cryptosporangium aurantiacum]
MTKFVLTLHVLAAVFLIGPMAIAPMMGMRAIRRHDARGVHEAARTTTLYTLLSLVVAGLGFLLIAVNNDRWSFGDTWIVISTTLYVIALLLGIGVVAPGLTGAARLLDASTTVPATPLSTPAETTVDPTTAEPAGTDTATIDVEARRKVDAAYGRIAASSGVVSLLLLIIVVLMVVRPFD